MYSYRRRSMDSFEPLNVASQWGGNTPDDAAEWGEDISDQEGSETPQQLQPPPVFTGTTSTISATTAQPPPLTRAPMAAASGSRTSNDSNGGSQTSLGSVGSLVIRSPMPSPGTLGAPYFDGTDVSDFVFNLECAADQANFDHRSLPQLVLQYCSPSVKSLLRVTPSFKGNDWAACVADLNDFYGSLDSKTKLTADNLRAWVKLHESKGSIKSQTEVDRYYRQYLQNAGDLVARGRLSQNDYNLLFYQGIPRELRNKVRTELKSQSPTVKFGLANPPPLTATRLALKMVFDEDDLDADVVAAEYPLYRPEEGLSSRHEKKPGKKTATIRPPTPPPQKTVTGPSPSDTAQDIQALARQLEDLHIQNAQLSSNSSNTSAMERKCWFCGESSHRLGIMNCPKAQECIADKTCALLPVDGKIRLFRADGSELPSARGAPGGVYSILKPSREAPAHTSRVGCTSVMFDGQCIMAGDVYGLSSISSSRSSYQTSASYPAARTEKDKSNRHDPKGRPSTQDADQPAPVKIRIPARPKQPKELPPSPSKPSPAPAPVPSTSTAPPTINTRDGHHRQKKRLDKAQEDSKDSEMKDGTKRDGPAYHFTSDLQEMHKGDQLVSKLLDSTVTLSLRELLGSSLDLQRRFHSLSKSRRDYVNKTVTAHLVDAILDEDYDSEPEDDIQEISTASIHSSYGTDAVIENGQVYESRVVLSWDQDYEDKEDVLVRYASAVKVLPLQKLFAMITGVFTGTFGGLPATFMVDTGSELNLVSRNFYDQTSLPVDEDGRRWSLKGIHGAPVPLGGCIINAPLGIADHQFPHHFFVSEEGMGGAKHDIILGQPWLQWYEASISYTRAGYVRMRLWQDGGSDAGERHTITIPLCAPSKYNVDRLCPDGKGKSP